MSSTNPAGSTAGPREWDDPSGSWEWARGTDGWRMAHTHTGMAVREGAPRIGGDPSVSVSPGCYRSACHSR